MKRKRIVFTTFLLSYILLALFIIAISSAVYGKYISLAKQRTEQYNILQLEKNISLVDKTLQDINNSLLQMADSEIIRNLSDGVEQMTMSELIRLQNHLKAYSINTEAVKVQFIGFGDRDYIIAKSGSSLSKEDYFQKVVKFEDSSITELENSVQERLQNRYVLPQKSVSISGESTTKVLPSMYALRDSNNVRKTGYIGTLFDAAYLKKSVLDNFDTTSLIVFDENKEFLFGDNHQDCEYEIGKMKSYGNLVTFSLRSEYNRWTYVVLMKKNTAFNSILYMRNIAYVVVLFVLIFGLAFGIFFSKKNALPIQKILDLVDSETDSNVYDNIYSYISLLKHDINDLQRYFEKNEDFIKGGIVKKIIDGSFESQNELDEQCAYTGLDFKDKVVWVTIIKSTLKGIREDIEMQEQELLEALSYSILEKNKQYYPMIEYYISRAMADTMVIMFCLPKRMHKEVLKCQNFFERTLQNQMYNKIGDEFYIKTGEFTFDATHINDTYQAVLTNLKELELIKKEENDLSESKYWYPLEIENKLINMSANGMGESLQEVIDEIIEINFKKIKINENDMRALYYEIKATLVKLLKMNSLEVSTEVISSPNEKDYYEAITYILNVFTEICQQNGERNKCRDDDNFESIKKFILKNYWNQNMSLSLIGEKFNLSESYISTLFKKYNQSYAVYLEKVRMESACKLLLSERIKMIEVAEIVGYNSDQSFRRAFKRNYGISPKKYKELYNGRGKTDENKTN